MHCGAELHIFLIYLEALAILAFADFNTAPLAVRFSPVAVLSHGWFAASCAEFAIEIQAQRLIYRMPSRIVIHRPIPSRDLAVQLSLPKLDYGFPIVDYRACLTGKRK